MKDYTFLTEYQKNHKRFLLRNKKKQRIKYNNYKQFIKFRSAIISLPKEIQRKIYIKTWRLYWRHYIPKTAQIPSWTKRANWVQKQLWEARQKNIHFLHLPFNTLPQNKQWILGCQCDFCLNESNVEPIEKHMHALMQYRNSSYFSDKMMPCETVSWWNEKYVLSGISESTMAPSPGYLIKIYDPLCGTYKESGITKKLKSDKPLYFTTCF